VSFKQKMKDEIKSVAVAMLYFGCWLVPLLLLKMLILDEYHIAFQGWSLAIVGTLVLSKVVLVLEHVSLGAWVRARPAWVDVVLRTVLYTLGVAVVLILEKGFEGRHEHGGFVPTLAQLFQQADIYHIWADTIVISAALLVYNILSLVQQHLGEGAVIRMLQSPLPQEPNSQGRAGAEMGRPTSG